jgi:2-amino-4-hydroxy-6-hydroxymethyldihydropteridine diphosphokinase
MYTKRRLNEKLSLLRGLRFPYRSQSISSLRYTTVVGIGGNVGDVKRRFEHLFFEIQREKRVFLQESALILKNPPFGFLDQDDFFNSIMVMKTSLQPHAFLGYLLRLEKKFRRRRSFENAPRTLDLDIIFFDNRVIKSSRLTLPHPFWETRESVIIPLKSLKI